MDFLLIKRMCGLAALLAAAGLSACAAPDATREQSTQQAGTGMSGGTASSATTSQGMDMNRMCAMHRDIQNAPPEQRQAMMERHMQQMAPEMRQRHMDMMRQHCQ